MDYATIYAPCTASLTEKKSEFIASLAPVQSNDEAVAFINQIKSENRKARHNVYAYLLRADNTSRYSDDGEPQGTAGIPVLEVLQKRGLTDICCVVTRYFGGILLGGGGLLRAYSGAASRAVQAAQIMQMRTSVTLSLRMDYTQYGKVSFALPAFSVLEISSEFGDAVTLQLCVMQTQVDALQKHLTDLTNGTIQITVLSKGFSDFSAVLEKK